ncbi:MAG: nucleotidyltransferase family protein [Clostridia bacterium]|nr:nucleotidyltransferase family protein [Clostridia bacterium]
MNICSIICEYNPLHEGHRRHIAFTKQQSEYVVAIMSGNFVQRGECAVLDKFTRARHAVACGVDMVIELPTSYALASADDFAKFGVKIADACGFDAISFGSECGNVELLEKKASALMSPPEGFANDLRSSLKSGESFPKTICKALGDNACTAPNDLLGTLYIKAAKEAKSDLRFLTLKRERSNDENCLSSANIRLQLAEKHIACGLLPDFVCTDLNNYCTNVAFLKYVHCAVQALSLSQLAQAYGIREGLENRIFRYKSQPDFDSFIFAVKSKRYTLASIKRALACAVLGITKESVKNGFLQPPYIKVLALKKDKSELLSYLSTREKMGKIILLDNLKKQSSLNVIQKQLLQTDIDASNLFCALHNKKGAIDFTTPFLV